MFTRRRRDIAVPEVGAEAPEFNLPSAQGGQLRLSMRTVRGPVVVAFYRPGNEEDVEFFKKLAGKEEEINLASGSVVGIGVAEPTAARDFARETGLKSYLLYDYAKLVSAQWGLLERDRKRGDSSRPGVFVVGPDHKVVHAWTAERPAPEELLEKVSAITGLPPTEEDKKSETDPAAAAGKPQKMSAEEREKIKAKRRAAREAGESVKTADAGQAAPGGGEQPQKMSKEEREKIKAERRAAREAGNSLKKDAAEAPADGGTPPEAPKKMSKEEREKIKAERRAAREAGQSLKKDAAGTGAAETTPAGAEGEAPAEAPSSEAPSSEAPSSDASPANAPAADAPKKMSKEERERIKAERRAAREAGQSLKKPAAPQASQEGPPEKE